MPPRKRTHQSSQTDEKITTTTTPKTRNTRKRQRLDASNTLYLTNLNSDIKPIKMRENLYILFSSFADILKLSYPRKNYRGQAWIVVGSADEAKECIEKLDGFQIFDKTLTVKVARKDSKIVDILSKNEDMKIS